MIGIHQNFGRWQTEWRGAQHSGKNRYTCLLQINRQGQSPTGFRFVVRGFAGIEVDSPLARVVEISKGKPVKPRMAFGFCLRRIARLSGEISVKISI